LGAILNEIGDVVSDTALYLPFAVVPGLPHTLIVFIVILGILTEMTGVVVAQIGAERRYDGPMGKSDRAFFFGLLALLFALGVPTGKWIAWVCGMIIVLLCLTIYNRALRGLKAGAS
jgi:CDP-diacylglycerol--glycerol-3-phosphate 3-phosphatidyltransferase